MRTNDAIIITVDSGNDCAFVAVRVFIRVQDDSKTCRQIVSQSCPWVGLTRGLGWVGSGMGRKFVL